jgi:hypothetical protein
LGFHDEFTLRAADEVICRGASDERRSLERHAFTA